VQDSSKNKTKFSITGNGYFIKLYDASHPFYLRLKEVDPVILYRKLFELDLFKTLDFRDESGNQYKKYSDVKPSSELVVYSLDVLTRIEIKREKSKRVMIKFSELVGDNLLFPHAYQTDTRLIEEFPLMIIEHDKGNFGSSSIPYFLEKEEELHFKLLTVPQINTTGVEGIEVAGETLVFRKFDTLNYSNHVFMS
jgi:hypothetical protein